MKTLFCLLLTIFSTTALAQEPAAQPATESKSALVKVERVGEDALRSFFMFSASGHDYTIRADGRGERSFANARSRNFTLKVEQGHIEQVYFLEFEGDLLLIYQLSDKQNSRGYVVRLNQTTLKPIWLKPVSDLDLEIAVVQAGYLNLGAADAIKKLDLRSGAFVDQ